MHFVFYNAFLDCCNPRLLNKADNAMQKYNHLDVIHALWIIKTGDMTTNQAITPC